MILTVLPSPLPDFWRLEGEGGRLLGLFIVDEPTAQMVKPHKKLTERATVWGLTEISI